MYGVLKSYCKQLPLPLSIIDLHNSRASCYFAILNSPSYSSTPPGVATIISSGVNRSSVTKIDICNIVVCDFYIQNVIFIKACARTTIYIHFIKAVFYNYFFEIARSNRMCGLVVSEWDLSFLPKGYVRFSIGGISLRLNRFVVGEWDLCFCWQCNTENK